MENPQHLPERVPSETDPPNKVVRIPRLAKRITIQKFRLGAFVSLKRWKSAFTARKEVRVEEEYD